MGRWLGCTLLLTFGCSQANPWFGRTPDETGDEATFGESSGDHQGTTSHGGPPMTGDVTSTATTSDASGPIDMDTSGPQVTTTGDESTSGDAGDDSGGAEVSTSTAETSSSSAPQDTGMDASSDGGDDTTGGDVECTLCGMPGCGECPVVNQVPFDAKFTIDMYEVRNNDYAQFLAAPVDPAGQPAKCAWNDDFTPQMGWPAPGEAGKLPVVSVDWCDAAAYCKWTGKRLCGAVGGGAGPTTLQEIKDKNVDQWFRACSGQAGDLYPYGQVYAPGTCNDAAAGHGKPVEVGSMTACEGSADGLFDMSGNVWEMTDACVSDEPFAKCLRRGGGFTTDDGKELRCDLQSFRLRNEVFPSVGFRCCADL